MPIPEETIWENKIYNFIKERSEAIRVETEHIQRKGKEMGLSNRQVGYVLQLLKMEKRIFWNRKRGWLSC